MAIQIDEGMKKHVEKEYAHLSHNLLAMRSLRNLFCL